MRIIHEIKDARAFINQGEVIAYPTEAVYGLGCNPFNKEAVEHLLQLKHRESSKGFILLIASWEQLSTLTAPIPDWAMQHVKETWPGPVTWIFPRGASIPGWITGERDTLAIRMSAHPIARELSLDGPLISTSANLSGQEPARSLKELLFQFPEGIAGFVQGELGHETSPTKIYDVLTGERLR
ncbi:L-threonylcarbamoyladenylate synthase [Legionella impletisoli]|uniref:Threonylcarbamoyl-AMP synthase n=1 Tax=Legionella impletisoli TaxID=343510 RepID=A0A917JW35_9GAMM|nr:L-threonylcarbamoyladenylate synthase [Legionella impletisoli]GGI89097.1 threonylcarbamoyl-AMP synthase [Legionella impletisoli]